MHKLVKIAFWIAMLFAFVMAILPQPPQLPGAPSDKFQHILAFMTLSLLGVLAFERRFWPLLLVGLVALGGGIEIVQMIPALNRTAEWRDFAADTGAVLLVLSLAFMFAPRTSRVST